MFRRLQVKGAVLLVPEVAYGVQFRVAEVAVAVDPGAGSRACGDYFEAAHEIVGGAVAVYNRGDRSQALCLGQNLRL